MKPPLYPVKLHSDPEGRIGFLNPQGEIVFDVPGDVPMGILTTRTLVKPDRLKPELILINDRGTQLNQINADKANTFFNGFCIVEIRHTDPDPLRISKYNKGLIDLSGNWVLKPNYADVTDIHEGFYARREKETELYSLYSLNGELSIPNLGLMPSHVSEGIISASDPKDHGVIGYRREDGGWLIEPQFDSAGPFHKGIAPVVRRISGEYVASLINKKGQEVVALSGIEGFKGEFSDQGVIGFRSPRQDGYMDTNGKILVTGRFQLLEHMEHGAAAVKVGDKWGLIGIDGKWRRKPEFGAFYRQYGPFFSFFAARVIFGVEIVLNSDGKTIWPMNHK